MTTPDFRPTHVVPQHGMPAWEDPDPARPTAPLDPLLPVQLVERRGDWGQIRCANGWSAWVDARHLVAVPLDPPLPGGPFAREDDPGPLLVHAERALAHYRAAVEEHASGTLDGETFRGRTRGLRVGVVVDGEQVWLYDVERSRWVHSDGTRAGTYATDDEPRAAVAPGHEPTQVVSPDGP
ncbi:hypothetical protein [Streptomyces boluensis]|uniref:Uncharacterized protein n=1 Tax=Streptomyces boluensis TaxID=1775135 RepID=A0A964V047_9ACTN|nr:hypothetical protein [Streptomyces boluensis]NBE56117.1 hypothetical protein [Streptomyces boluensis]